MGENAENILLISCLLPPCFRFSKHPACEFRCRRRHAQLPSLCGRCWPTTHLLDFNVHGHSRPIHRAPSCTESGHCRWRRKWTSLICCQKNRHPCGGDLLSPGSLTVPLEFTTADSLGGRFFGGIWHERAEGDHNTCAFARVVHPSWC